jgi:hypothetical protein
MDPVFHPVYKALIQRPAWWGVDQRFVLLSPFVFVVSTIVGVMLVLLTGNGSLVLWAFFLGGVAGVLCHLLLSWMYAHEPNFLPMVWRAARQKGRYDPLKHEPVYLEVRAQWKD